MLVHPWDASDDPDEWRAFVVATGFGHLVAAGCGRDVAVVVPTQFVLAGEEVVLHLARANPVWAALDENPSVLLSVAGDWAYIPSSWKAVGDEDPACGIPTTYYAAVQLRGAATVIDDADELAAVLRTQLGTLEPQGGHVDPAEHQRRFAAIRALRIPVEAVTAKFKYGGNVDSEHRLAVAERLRERSGPGDEAARGHLLRRLGDGPRTGG
jgi:transcriptional regulator